MCSIWYHEHTACDDAKVYCRCCIWHNVVQHYHACSTKTRLAAALQSSMLLVIQTFLVLRTLIMRSEYDTCESFMMHSIDCSSKKSITH